MKDKYCSLASSNASRAGPAIKAMSQEKKQSGTDKKEGQEKQQSAIPEADRMIDIILNATKTVASSPKLLGVVLGLFVVWFVFGKLGAWTVALVDMGVRLWYTATQGWVDTIEEAFKPFFPCTTGLSTSTAHEARLDVSQSPPWEKTYFAQAQFR